MSRWCIVCAAALSLALLVSCRAKNHSVQDAAAFSQAPPEMKQLWDLALAASATNDYVTAQTLFFGLLREQLTPEQRQAVASASTAVNDRLSKALQAGDPSAKAALAELRRRPPNRPQ